MVNNWVQVYSFNCLVQSAKMNHSLSFKKIALTCQREILNSILFIVESDFQASKENSGR